MTRAIHQKFWAMINRPKPSTPNISVSEVVRESLIDMKKAGRTHWFYKLVGPLAQDELHKHDPADIAAMPMNNAESTMSKRLSAVERAITLQNSRIALQNSKITSRDLFIEKLRKERTLFVAREVIKTCSREVINEFFAASAIYVKNPKAYQYLVDVTQTYTVLKGDKSSEAVEFVACYNRMLKNFGQDLGNMTLLANLKIDRDNSAHAQGLEVDEVLERSTYLDDKYVPLEKPFKLIVNKYWLKASTSN